MPANKACAFCGAEVQGNYREVTGWEKRRRSGRMALNAVVARVNTGREACDSCGYDLAHGMAPGSAKLFPIGDLPVPPPPPRRDHA